MTKPAPVPTPVPLPEIPEGSAPVPVFGRREGSQSAVVAWILVDIDDLPLVAVHRWSFAGRGYARTGRDSLYVHRLLIPGVDQVDHINGNKLDNRKANLRPATNAENHRGHSSRAPGTSGYRGVVKDKKTWKAHVTVDGVVHTKYGFPTPEAAVQARDEMAQELHGEFYQSAQGKS